MRRNRRLILVSLLLAAFATNLDTTIVKVALPTLVRELHTSNSQLQWVVDAFNLLFAGSVMATAFFHGFSSANYLVAGVATAGALMALALLPAHPTPSRDDTAEVRPARLGLPGRHGQLTHPRGETTQ